MIDLYIGGACPRRSLTYALPRALVCPSAPLDASLPNSGLGVIASNGSMKDSIPVISKVVAKTGRTWLVANFEDEYTNICNGIMHMRPTPAGVDIVMVHPFLSDNAAPMTLVSSCAGRAFGFDAHGQEIDLPPPERSKASAGADRGWGELKRRMEASAKGYGFWPWESWELCVA